MCRNTLPTQSSETVKKHSYLGDSVCLHPPALVVSVKDQSFPSLTEEVAAYPSWCHAQVTDSLNHFRKLRVKWHPNTGMAMETDGTIASPWSGLHFLVLSGARVCLPVGYGSDGRLSLSRLLPGKPPSIWKRKGRPPGLLREKNWEISLIILPVAVSRISHYLLQLVLDM